MVPASVVALIGMARLPPTPTTRRPLEAMVETCSSQVSTSVTSRPPSASRPPNRPPMAPAPITTTLGFSNAMCCCPCSDCGLVAVLDDAEHLVGVALPPIALREDLDLDVAVVAGRLHHAADAGDVDQAVAHHAAVQAQVLRVGEPVVDVEVDD